MMKVKWLLLAVSVICVLVLVPAAAFSQDDRYVQVAGCGTARLDGVVGGAEWAGAAEVPLAGYLLGPVQDGTDAEAHAAGPGEVHANPDGMFDGGTAYFMTDGPYLYVGGVVGDPEDWLDDASNWYDLWMAFEFEDEPPGDPGSWVDCEWDALLCEDSDEGMFGADITEEPGGSHYGTWFNPDADEGCDWDVLAEPEFGIVYAAAPHGDEAHFEMRVDLANSHLNNVGPDTCFDLNWVYFELWGCENGNPDCDWESPEVLRLEAYWPGGGGECPILCLPPCEVPEEFVPEPGTIMLLASGLMGMAGYAGLRLRKK